MRLSSTILNTNPPIFVPSYANGVIGVTTLPGFFENMKTWYDSACSYSTAPNNINHYYCSTLLRSME
jgi:hypothetical protein